MCGKQFEVLFDNIFEYIWQKFQIRMFYLSTVSYFILKNNPSPIFLDGISMRDCSLREPSNACSSGKIRLEASPFLFCRGYYIDTKAAME
jgi:hypothetical protein